MPRERSYRRRQRRQKNEMNVVPYIDVMLVLLVIFMVTAPMITPGIIDLPTVGEASEVPATPVEVQLGEDGVLAVRLREANTDFSPSSPEALIDDIQAIATDQNPVVIAADGQVPYEEVMEIMDQLRRSGFTRLGFLVNQDSSDES
ncbi:MAG TPA: ExbD/TolR family protein [Paenalcaligenes sp.]|nr:ExbD/TolR family protein [Paenalcaligenes sp.]